MFSLCRVMKTLSLSFESLVLAEGHKHATHSVDQTHYNINDLRLQLASYHDVLPSANLESLEVKSTSARHLTYLHDPVYTVGSDFVISFPTDERDFRKNKQSINKSLSSP